MKKHEKRFLHDTDQYNETASYAVETLQGDAIDLVFRLSDGKNEFELWEFASTQGGFDDTLAKLDSIHDMLVNARKALLSARHNVEFDE